MYSVSSIHTKSIEQRLIHTSKFKSNAIVIKLTSPLDAKRIMNRSIISRLMMKSNSEFINEQQLLDHLSELYGAHLSSSVSKQGDYHVFTLALEFINEKFIQSNQLIDEAVQFIMHHLYSPIYKSDKLTLIEKAKHQIEQEKLLFKDKFINMKDNSAQMSFLKLIEEMYADDYRYFSQGNENLLNDASFESVIDEYSKMIQNDHMTIYIVGDECHEISKRLTPLIKYEENDRVSIHEHHRTAQFIEDQDKVLTEYKEVEQAKLNIGFKTDLPYNPSTYYDLMVLNYMLGGHASSLLFSEVREKESLAYQIHSQIDNKKGGLYIVSGVPHHKVDKANEVIFEQIEKLKNNQFDDEMLRMAKVGLYNSRVESLDRIKSIVMQDYQLKFINHSTNIFDWMQKINNVTREDIVNVAKSLTHQKTYIMTRHTDQ